MLNKTIFFLLIFSFCANIVLASETNGTIDSSYKYAWGGNIGWINFKPDNGGLSITDTGITGYAWSSVAGWINFNPTNGGVTNDCNGILGGYAWSSQLGWIPMSGGSIDSQGLFKGTVGSSTMSAGSISFDCDNCRVVTDWKQCSLRVQSVSTSTDNNQGASTTRVLYSGSSSSSGSFMPIISDVKSHVEEFVDRSINNMSNGVNNINMISPNNDTPIVNQVNTNVVNVKNNNYINGALIAVTVLLVILVLLRYLFLL